MCSDNATCTFQASRARSPCAACIVDDQNHVADAHKKFAQQIDAQDRIISVRNMSKTFHIGESCILSNGHMQL